MKKTPRLFLFDFLHKHFCRMFLFLTVSQNTIKTNRILFGWAHYNGSINNGIYDTFGWFSVLHTINRIVILDFNLFGLIGK